MFYTNFRTAPEFLVFSRKYQPGFLKARAGNISNQCIQDHFCRFVWRAQKRKKTNKQQTPKQTQARKVTETSDTTSTHNKQNNLLKLEARTITSTKKANQVEQTNNRKKGLKNEHANHLNNKTSNINRTNHINPNQTEQKGKNKKTKGRQEHTTPPHTCIYIYHVPIAMEMTRIQFCL